MDAVHRLNGSGSNLGLRYSRADSERSPIGRGDVGGESRRASRRAGAFGGSMTSGVASSWFLPKFPSG
jgi:hypothetical protein